MEVEGKSKKTLVVGASANTARYSNIAVADLTAKGHEVVAIGLREGEIHGVPILKGKPVIENIDTVTLYIGPQNQPDFYEYLLALNPKRIIMNPGTENKELADRARKAGIEVEMGCTLVMLSVNTY